MNIGKNIVSISYKLGIKKLINISSSCMYPRDINIPIKETDILTNILEPTNEGYALAKIVTLKLCEYINKENKGFAYKTLIPCNLYGYYDSFSPEKSHLIPAIINKLHIAKINNIKEVEIWGDGNSRREFMFSSDLAKAISKAIDDIDKLPDIMNIGTGIDYKIKEYYEIAAEIIKFKGSFSYNLEKPTGMKRKIVDISLQKKWGWEAETKLKDGVRLTYNYFLNQLGKS